MVSYKVPRLGMLWGCGEEAISRFFIASFLAVRGT